MIKQLLLRTFATLITAFLFQFSFGQDTWTSSQTNGFGNVGNQTIRTMIPFKGQIYAGTSDYQAEIWRSPTGNYGSWSNAFSDVNAYHISSMATSNDGAGYIYMSAYQVGSFTPIVYSSTDGATWSPFLQNSTTNEYTFVIPFKGTGAVDSIYVFENGPFGTKVYRAQFDSNDPLDTLASWDTVFDLGSSFAMYASVTSTAVFNGKLYAGTDFGGTLWSTSDGTTWTKNDSVGLGFGDINNNAITAIEGFGGFLYVATSNSTGNAQVWRSADELTWTQVYSGGGIYANFTDLYNDGTTLWLAGLNGNGGPGLIVKTTDGTTFTVSTNDGLSQPQANHGEYGNFTSFGNNIYYGSRVYGMLALHSPTRGGGSTGGQIWRSCIGVTPPTISVGPDQVNCDNTMAIFNADPGFISYSWDDGTASQMLTTNVPGNHYVIATDINGCDAVDTANLSLIPAPTITVTTPNLMQATLCKGDSMTTVNTAVSNLRVTLPAQNRILNDTVFDYATIEDTINVSGLSGFEMAGTSIVSVTIDSLYHGNDADLHIVLFAPDGSYTDLSYYEGWSSQNFIGTTFTSTAPTTLSSGIPPYTGNFLPDGNFSAFGGPANGNWRLSLYDSYPGNIGVLKGWSITMSVKDTMLTFSWTPTAGVADATALNTTITPTGSIIYTLTTTNTIGCTAAISDTLKVPAIDIPLTHDTICYGAFAMISASGGNTYHWSPSTALSDTTGAAVTANPTAPLEYYVMDTVSGCIVMDSINIYVNAQLFLTPPTSQVVCFADSLAMTSTVSGGTGPYIFSWYDGASTLVGSTINLPYTSGTSYTVTVQDAYDCAISGTTNVTVMPSTDIYGHASYSGGNVAGSNVVLYRYYPFLTHFDTVQVATTDAAGNYMFTSVNHFDYLVEVFPAASYTTLVPTYYGNKFVWDSATVVNHDCAANDTLDIAMVEETLIAGPGAIGGRIVEGMGFVRAPGDPVPGIDVKLGRNPGGQLVTNTQTDNNGNYTFSGVAYNNPGEHYTVYVDIPGLDRDSSYSVVLDAAHAVYDSLNYLVDSTSIYIVPTSGTGVGTISGTTSTFSIYPNPAHGNATIEYSLNTEAEVSLGIYNVLGVKILDLVNMQQSQGSYRYSINAKNNNLTAGVYFVTLITNGKTNIHKIVITE